MWTATELKSKHKRYDATVWRMVEAQHKISTLRLAQDLESQHRLEELAEQVKPTLPKSAQGLHWLLAGPFRYGYQNESRFRRAREKPGIFCSTEDEQTTLIEVAYWRLRLFSRSPEFHRPRSTIAYTSFTVDVTSQATLDLTTPPFDRFESKWRHPRDYSRCQSIAQVAREAKTQCIRSISARDPARGCNVAILDPAVFCERAPSLRHTWNLRCESDRIFAHNTLSGEVHVFDAVELEGS